MSIVTKVIAEGQINVQTGERVELTEQFAVVVDRLDGLETLAVRAALADYDFGRLHPDITSPRLYSQGIQADLEETRNLFRVQVPYSTDRPLAQSPLAQPADIQWDTFTVREFVDRDADGKPVLNTAGELYDHQEDVEYWGMRITKNLARVPDWVLRYRRAINADAIDIDGIAFRKHTLRIAQLSISGRRFSEDVEFRTVSLTVLHNPATWVTKLPNVGWHERVQTRASTRRRPQYVLRPVTTPGSGEPATTPQWLDKDGRQLREPSPSGFGEVLSVPPIAPNRLLFNDFWFSKRLPFSAISAVLR